MARGFLSGIIWGGVVSVMGAGAASIIADDRTPPVADVQAPSSAAAPEATADTTASAVTDADVVRAGKAPQGASPEADDVAAATAAGADTPAVPQTGEADALPDPADAPASSAIEVDDVDPVAPSIATNAPQAPESETALSISTEPAQSVLPEVAQTEAALAPEEGEAPTPPIAESPAPEVPQVAQAPEVPAESDAPAEVEAQPDTSAAPEIAASEPAAPEPDTPELATPEQPADSGEQSAALPNALDSDDDVRPRIGRPAVSLVDRTPEVPAADTATDTSPDADAEVEAEVQATDARAIRAHAAAFDNPDDKPLMSIVLIDSGVDLTGGPVGLAALQSFPYPLTFAVDASLADAATRMADYRRQGFEVMALIDLPAGATASDAEVSLSAALRAVPEAVAVMEGPGTGLQENRDAADQIAQAVLATGHGLVLESKGLNTTHKLAAREGVPAGLIFRDFDSADQTPSVIRRFLDQAAFRAGQEGGVIMVGRVRPDTISALLLWGLQDRAERVTLAPISAVLTTLVTPQ